MNNIRCCIDMLISCLHNCISNMTHFAQLVEVQLCMVTSVVLLIGELQCLHIEAISFEHPLNIYSWKHSCYLLASQGPYFFYATYEKLTLVVRKLSLLLLPQISTFLTKHLFVLRALSVVGFYFELLCNQCLQQSGTIILLTTSVITFRFC